MQGKIFKGALIGTGVLYVLYQLLAFVIVTVFFVKLYNMYTLGEYYTPVNQVAEWARDLLYWFVQLLFIGIGIFFAVRYRKNVPAIIGGSMLSLYAFTRIVQLVLRYLYHWMNNSCLLLQGKAYQVSMSAVLMVILLLIAINYKSVGMMIVSVIMSLYKIVWTLFAGSVDCMHLSSIIISRSLAVGLIILEIVVLCMWIWNESKQQKLTN